MSKYKALKEGTLADGIEKRLGLIDSTRRQTVSTDEEFLRLKAKFYYSYLNSILENVIKWEGLEDFLNYDMIEKFLSKQTNKGNEHVVFFEDDIFGKIISNAVMIEEDIFGNIVKFSGMNPLGKESKVYMNKDKEAVIVRNRFDKLNYEFQLREFASTLAELDLLIKTNRIAAVKPLNVITEEGNEISTVQTIREGASLGTQIIMKKGNGMENEKKLQPQLQNSGITLMSHELESIKDKILMDWETFVGLFPADVDKRERMINAEISANTQINGINRDSFMKTRAKAIEEINSLWGLNATVDYIVKDINAISEDRLEEEATQEEDREVDSDE